MTHPPAGKRKLAGLPCWLRSLHTALKDGSSGDGHLGDGTNVLILSDAQVSNCAFTPWEVTLFSAEFRNRVHMNSSEFTVCPSTLPACAGLEATSFPSASAVALGECAEICSECA